MNIGSNDDVFKTGGRNTYMSSQVLSLKGRENDPYQSPNFHEHNDDRANVSHGLMTS